MILFWAIAATMLAGALCFVLPPLARRGATPAARAREIESIEVYRAQSAELDVDLASGAIDAAQYDDALRALKRRMLEELELTPASGTSAPSTNTSKLAAIAIAVTLPLAVVALYLVLGNPEALSPQPAAAEPVAAAPAPGAPVSDGGTPTPAKTPGPTDPVTPEPVAASLTASIDVNGVAEPAAVGGAIPAAAPQFTVKYITNTTVTLQLMSGTLPGGGTTIDLAKDVPVTLNNPSTGANLTLTVKEIKASV